MRTQRGTKEIKSIQTPIRRESNRNGTTTTTGYYYLLQPAAQRLQSSLKEDTKIDAPRKRVPGGVRVRTKTVARGLRERVLMYEFRVRGTPTRFIPSSERKENEANQLHHFP